MGEYSVGKSSLLNLLLGVQLLPARVTATRLPTVWITHGETRKVEVLDYDGTFSSIPDPDADLANLSDNLVIRCTLPSEILRNTDIIDTPGISDPNLADDIVELITPHVDFVVWCTSASQAWRQTETAAWNSVSYELQDNSLLAITRIDLLGAKKDVNRVVTRCQRDAGKSFYAIIPISTKTAKTGTDEGWQDSGAAALVSAIEARVAASLSYRAERREREGEIAVAEPVPTSVEIVHVAGTDTQSIEDCIAAAIADVTSMTSNENIIASFDQLKTTFIGDEVDTDSHASVIHELLSLRVQDDTDSTALNRQIHHELKDFSEGPWCQLGKQK
ncbi:dynamin family protein [Yoonia sp. 1_MG-2023]|nr:dynamin family protein [Yoonia sp. 1_MG-2023]MDO6590356.1 dynamin family protein [Yoonia sp. 1_MG-2023]